MNLVIKKEEISKLDLDFEIKNLSNNSKNYDKKTSNEENDKKLFIKNCEENNEALKLFSNEDEISIIKAKNEKLDNTVKIKELVEKSFKIFQKNRKEIFSLFNLQDQPFLEEFLKTILSINENLLNKYLFNKENDNKIYKYLNLLNKIFDYSKLDKENVDKFLKRENSHFSKESEKSDNLNSG